MARSISSENQTSNLASHQTSGHSLFWWSLKIICGASLITALFLKVIYQLTPWFYFPVVAAQLLVFTGAGLTLWHYLKLKRSSRDISQPKHLVCRAGLYKFIRHPMYFADMLVSIGLFLLFPTIVTTLILLVGLIGMVRQSQVEDLYMQSLFVDEFDQWRAKTKLILPFIY